MIYKAAFGALSALALAASGTAYAGESSRILITPVCLLQKTHHSYETLAKNNTLAMIKTNDAGVDALVDAKNHPGALCGGFVDVSDSSNPYALLKTNNKTNPSLLASNSYDIHYQTEVNQLLATVNPQSMWANLTVLTSHPNRYSRSDEGVKAAAWIKANIEETAKGTGRTDITTYYVQTGGKYKQPSVVVKVGNSNEAGVVIGAHMDTLDSSFELKPGADDDGSGSVTVMEAARAILTSGMQFKKPIYFVWYAAEEEGLIGSQHVVADFKQKKIPVNAVIHFDMTGYAYKNQPTMWLMDDYTNKDLNIFIEKLITTYVKKPVKHSRCGYACSDHASWTQAGYPASIPAEAAYEDTNPNMHSSNDTMDNLSLDHMTDYAKLATAAAVELAEPVKK